MTKLQTVNYKLTVVRFANDKLLPKDCLNILCVMKFRGSEVTTSGTSKPIRSGEVTLQNKISSRHIHVPQLFVFMFMLLCLCNHQNV